MLSRLSLKTILVAGALLITTILITVLWIGSVRALRDAAVAQAMHLDQRIAKVLAAEYKDFLGLHLRAVGTVATHATALASFDTALLQPLLVRTRMNYAAFDSMLVVNPAGASIAADPAIASDGQSTIGLDYTDREYFQEVLRVKKPLVGKGVVIDKITRQPLVSLVAPILDASGKLQGVVVAGLALEAIQQLTNQIRLRTSGYAQAATAQGLVLASPHAELVEQRNGFSTFPIWAWLSANEEGEIPSYRGVTGEERLAGFATVPNVGWKVWVSRAVDEVQEDVITAYRKGLVWEFFALLAVVGLAIALAIGIAHPLQRLQVTAQAITAGALEQRAREQGPKEIVALARAFNRMAESLRHMVTLERDGKMQLEHTVDAYGRLAARVMQGDLSARVTTDSGSELSQLGQNLNHMIEALERLLNQIREAAQDITVASTEILAATSQQAQTITEESTAIQQTSTTVDEVRQTAQVAAQKALPAADAVRRTAQVSEDGRRAVVESINGIQETKGRMETLAERILNLSEQGEAIGEILTVVNDLTEQSNLLAVNASIEAAKAGEVGKGFAVVAVEMKELADQSRQATAQIRGILREIQRATQAAVLAAEQGVHASEIGEDLARRAGEAIQLLSENLTESAQAAQHTLVSTQQQAAGMDQVVIAMQNIQQAATQNMAATRQVEQAARNLNALAQRLSMFVSLSNTGTLLAKD